MIHTDQMLCYGDMEVLNFWMSCNLRYW